MGKGSQLRKGANIKKFKENYDEINWKSKKYDLPLFEVGILPDNKPEIILGKYRASSKKRAIQIAALDNNVSTNIDWFAREVK